MRRAIFYRATVSAALLGAVIAAGLFGSWRLLGVPFDDDLWIRLYPASIMFMLAEHTTAAGTAAIVLTSIATNAALYFIAASILCGLVLAFRGGLRD